MLPFYGNGTAIEHLRRFEETPVLPLVCSSLADVISCDLTLVFQVKDVASALSYMQAFDPPFTHGELKAVSGTYQIGQTNLNGSADLNFQSNILIDDNEKALLCDFGLGSINGVMNFTSANVCGTCRWTAPEIMTPPEDMPFVPSTPASDVYSFAMTMIEVSSSAANSSLLRLLIPNQHIVIY